MKGYKTLDDAYNEGWTAFENGEPNNLWSPYANAEEAEVWRIGWNDARCMRRSEEAWEEETKRVSKLYSEPYFPNFPTPYKYREV